MAHTEARPSRLNSTVITAAISFFAGLSASVLAFFGTIYTAELQYRREDQKIERADWIQAGGVAERVIVATDYLIQQLRGIEYLMTGKIPENASEAQRAFVEASTLQQIEYDLKKAIEVAETVSNESWLTLRTNASDIRGQVASALYWFDALRFSAGSLVASDEGLLRLYFEKRLTGTQRVALTKTISTEMRFAIEARKTANDAYGSFNVERKTWDVSN